MLPSAIQKCLEYFAGVDRTLTGYEGLIAAQDCLPNDERRDAFASDFSVLSRIWEALSPDPILTPHEKDYRWLAQVGEATGTVIATYRDLEAGEDVEVKVGDEEPVRRLRQRFRSQVEARAVADSEARRAGRAKETLEIELPGNPSIVVEGKVVPIAFSSASSGVWLVETATHEVSEAGYRSMVQAQRAS